MDDSALRPSDPQAAVAAAAGMVDVALQDPAFNPRVARVAVPRHPHTLAASAIYNSADDGQNGGARVVRGLSGRTTVVSTMR